jgi:hypothetical protein
VSVPQPVQPPPPTVAPYHPPPSYPPPTYRSAQALDSRAVIALVLAIFGLLVGLPLGIPGMVLGAVAYFMGKSAVRRIEASAGALGGRNAAMFAWILGIVATVVGAVVSLIWLVVILALISTPTA